MDLQQTAQSIFDAVMNHQWWLLASLVLSLAVAGLRWAVPKVHGRLGAWLNTDRGGAATVLLTAVLGALGTTFAAGKQPGWDVLVKAVITALGAAGGFNLVKKLLTPPPVGLEGAPVMKRAMAPPPLPIVIALALPLLASCSYCAQPAHQGDLQCKIVQVGKQCGEPAVFKVVLQILPTVVQDLVQDNFASLLGDLVQTLKNDGMADAMGAVTCAVQITASNAAPTPLGKSISPQMAKAGQHAVVWLATGGKHSQLDVPRASELVCR